MAALSWSWISFFTWWASYSRHRPVWETPAFHTQPDEQGGLKPQTTASLSWKFPCLTQTDNDWILRRTQTRGCLRMLCRTHLDSDPGLREWRGSWEICEPRSEGVEEEAARPEDAAFHPPHMQPHTVLYEWVITPHFLDSGFRAELTFPPLPTREHTCSARALAHSLQRHLCWEGNIAKRQGRADKGGRESKNEMRRDQNRPVVRNRHSYQLLCTLDVKRTSILIRKTPV